MPQYSLFGGCFSSDIPFPELRPTDDPTTDWTFRRASALPPMAQPVLMSDGVWPSGIRLSTYSHGGGFRLDYSDTGVFDISPDGALITWCPRPDTSEEVARHDTLGIVLSMALHAAGLLPLHGSAVAIGGAGVAFLAPSGTGKSTLALALVRGGARMLTDDTLPVDLGPPVTAWPGVQSV